MTYWLKDWLIDWWIDRFIVCLIDRLIDQLLIWGFFSAFLQPLLRIGVLLFYVNLRGSEEVADDERERASANYCGPVPESCRERVHRMASSKEMALPSLAPKTDQASSPPAKTATNNRKVSLFYISEFAVKNNKLPLTYSFFSHLKGFKVENFSFQKKILKILKFFTEIFFFPFKRIQGGKFFFSKKNSKFLKFFTEKIVFFPDSRSK